MERSRARVPALMAMLLVASMAAGCGGSSGSSDPTTTDPTTPEAAPTSQSSGDAGSTTTPTAATTQPTTTTTTEPPASTTSTTTTTTTVPPPDPAPVAASGWEDVDVGSVCVVVHEAYPQLEEGHTERIDRGVARLLEALDIEALGPGAACDAVLTFDLEGRALSEQYSGQDGEAVTRWAGAVYEGSSAFTGDGSEVTVRLSSRLDPPFAVWESHPEPADAPWAAVWVGPVLETLGEIFGPVAVVETIGRWPSAGVLAVVSEVALGWIVDQGDVLVDPLLDLSRDRAFAVHEPALAALGRLVADGVVDGDTASRIVRSLIEAETDPARSGAPGDALRVIAQRTAAYDEVPGYFVDSSGAITGPWDGPAWEAWAEDEGY